MFVSGLTVLRNAVTFQYPFLESIRSALPICDEFIAVVGKSDDDTLETIRGLNEPKIRIVETVWSEKVKPQKSVLAQQTNIGLHLCRGDWVIYLQANEVLHEASLPVLLDLMKKHEDNPQVEALLLERLTFWGDYQHMIGVYPERFKFSPRILRPYLGTYSIRDAMSVAVFDNFSIRGRYPRAMDTGQNLFRYGYVRSYQQLKEKETHAVHKKEYEPPHFDKDYFFQAVPRQHIRVYQNSHPKVMQERIRSFTQKISLDDPRWRTGLTLKERQRLAETWYYERFGVPRIRSTRYVLIGHYLPKKKNVLNT